MIKKFYLFNFFKNFFSKIERKEPEDYYVTKINHDSVKVEHPERETEEILWKDIEQI